MPTNAIACRSSIRRFKRSNYQLIDQSNFVPNNFLVKNKGTRDWITGALREYSSGRLKHLLVLKPAPFKAMQIEKYGFYLKSFLGDTS
jgi:hypothetical protein